MDFHCFLSIILLYCFCSANSVEPLNSKNILQKLLLTQLTKPDENSKYRYNILQDFNKWYHNQISKNDLEIGETKSEIMEQIQQLDQVEEQSNSDLVQGINLMAERNETLDQVLDNVLESR